MTQNKTEILITAKDQTERAFRSVQDHYKDLSNKAEGFNDKLQSQNRLLAAFGVTMSAGAFVAWIKGAVDAADELSKMSQKIGVGVEDLARLQYAASLADVSNEELAKGIKQLNKNMLDAVAGSKEQSAAFKALHVEVRNTDGSMKSSIVTFREVADRFAALEDGPTKTAIAMKLFGKSGADLIPLLNEGAAGLKELGDEAERLGLVISTQTAQSAEEFNDNLTRLKSSTTGWAFEIANYLLPPLVDLSNELVKIAQSSGTAYEKLNKFLAIGLSSSPAGMLVNFKGSALGLLMGYGEEKTGSLSDITSGLGSAGLGAAGSSAMANGGKSEIERALDRYLAAYNATTKKAKTAKQLAAEEKRQLSELQRELAKAAEPGGLYEWFENFQANQDIANFQPKLKAPEIKPPTFDLGFQDVAFKSLEEQQDAFQATGEELDKLAQRYDELFGIRIPSAFDGAQDAWADYSRYAQDSTAQTFDAVSFSIRETEDVLLDFVMTGKANFEDLAKSIIASFARIQIQKLLAGAGNGLLSLFGGGGTVIDGVGTLDWLQGRASGGTVFGGTSYLVGEKGPELFTPGSSGFITPNSAITGGLSISITVPVSVENNKKLAIALQDGIESTVLKIIKEHS